MENSQLRKFFGMKNDQSGVLITFINPLSCAQTLHVGELKERETSLTSFLKDDVLLSIDGTNVGNDGTVAFRTRGERISLDYVILRKFVGDKAKLKVLRQGKVHSKKRDKQQRD
jgi:hypothetical protein